MYLISIYPIEKNDSGFSHSSVSNDFYVESTVDVCMIMDALKNKDFLFTVSEQQISSVSDVLNNIKV